MISNTEAGRIKSILIIRFQRLGDLILVLTLVQNLRTAFPNARLTLLCQEIYADFFRQQIGVDDVVAIPKKAGLKGQLAGWLAALRSLIKTSFDLVIDVSDNRRSSQLTRLTRAPLRIGFWPPTRSRRSIWEKGCYNLFAPTLPLEEEKHGHFVNRYLAPLQVLGVPVYLSKPSITATEADRVTVGKFGLGARPYAVIHPGARTPNRRWPAKGYVPVIEHLMGRGISVVIIGDDSERPIADEIAEMSVAARFINLVGKLTLGQLAALLERCTLYIGNNTGPMHIAAGVGARIVAIYGIHATLWAPLTEDHVMVAPALPCKCIDPTLCQPHNPDASLCINHNSVADVLRAVDTQLLAAERAGTFSFSPPDDLLSGQVSGRPEA
jgi:heptosyltransferase-3